MLKQVYEIKIELISSGFYIVVDAKINVRLLNSVAIIIKNQQE